MKRLTAALLFLGLLAGTPALAQNFPPGGNPIAPDQPCTDDSDRIANTHFVHNCGTGGGGGGGGSIPLGLGFTITPGQDNPADGVLATPLVVGTNTLYGQIDPLPFFVDTPITATMMGHLITAEAGVSILFTLPQAGTTGAEKGVSTCFQANGSGGLTLTAAGGSLLHGALVSSNILTSPQYGNGCAASDGIDWNVSWAFPAGGGGIGTVTSISAGDYIINTPDPIIATGSVAVSATSCSGDHKASQANGSTNFDCITDVAQFDKNQTWTKNQAMPPTILTPGASIAWNGLDRNYYKVTLNGNNQTLTSPTNLQPGNYTFFIYTGAGFTGFSTDGVFQFVGGTPVWSTAAGKEDVISCLVDDTLVMACFAGIDVGGSGGGLLLTSAHLYVGNASNIATDVAVSGVLTLANTGAFSFASSTGSGAVVLATGPSISALTVTSSFTATGLVTLADIATEAANTVVANVTAGTASPTAASLPSCIDTGGNHLNYTNGTGFSCGTSGGAAGSLVVGTTTVTSGTSGRLLFDNAGVLGEPTITAASASGALTLGSTTGPVAGSVTMWGSTSGSLQVKPAAAAGTSSVLTLPGGTTDFSATGGTSQFVKQASAGAAFTVAQPAFTDISGVATSAQIPATTLATGTSVSLTAPRQYYVCTSTCTVTPPVPAAGYEFCVMNDDNVATVITLAALGSSARYESSARTGYGTAGTGTFVSGGAVADSVCIVGLDSTHYLTTNFKGTWTAS